MKFSDDDLPIGRPERPIGVSIITVWDSIFFGIIPIVSIVFSLVRGYNTGEDPVSIYLTTILAVLIITVSIGTFTGNDRSRSFLIYLVTIYQSLQAFQSVVLLASGSLQPADTFYAIGTILAAFFWIALHVWYFLKPDTLEFYRRPQQIQP